VLTLLVIPTFYDIITRWRDWAIGKLRGKKHHAPAVAAHGAGAATPLAPPPPVEPPAAD
jgi:hypothetical protein